MKVLNHGSVVALGLAILNISVAIASGQDFTYKTNNGAITITGGCPQGGVAVIPPVINGLPVTSIGSSAFYHCGSLTNVTISENVTSIGVEAFVGCPNLTAIQVDPQNPTFSSVNGVLFKQTTIFQYPGGRAGTYSIPDGITSIGDSAFSQCANLTGVTIPNSVTSLEDFAFSGSANLQNIVIPEGVTNIGWAAFSDCLGLTGVTIPGSVRQIRTFAFSGCNGLTEVILSDGVASVGDAAFSDCSGLKSISIPDSVASVSYHTFYRCTSLGSVMIGNGVTSIGDQAFYQCTGLTNVTIGNSVTNIGLEAFSGCTSLTSVTLPSGVTSIGLGAFSGCANLVRVDTGKSVADIGVGAFGSCSNLTDVILPDTVVSIGSGAFSFTGLKSLYFEGAAPTLVGSVFPSAGTTVYFLPGTAGWDTTFGGAPTAQWEPRVETSDHVFGVHTNQFGFTVRWAPDQVVVVEATTNLSEQTWSPVGTNILTGGSSFFSDPQASKVPRRFYRIRSPK